MRSADRRLPRIAGTITAVWRSRPWIADAAVAVAVLAAELPYRDADLALVALALAVSGAMAARRGHPIAVVALVGVLCVLGARPPWHDAPVSAMIIALYAVGRHTPAWASTASAAVAMAGHWLLYDLPWAPAPLGMTVALALTPAAPVAAGHIMRLRGELAQRREQRIAAAWPANCTT
ncbi:DUF7134 domain-containing protein [Spongiactinospora gelatinilytica]|uniref:DUF7134 domain-containing protein n=1 Tax=Spongiactinospora gelatinilytica TaxID=2666298 RepID=UPI001F2E9469|nr:hypothetical protein [Spongiactinospora gelatinilytica]